MPPARLRSPRMKWTSRPWKVSPPATRRRGPALQRSKVITKVDKAALYFSRSADMGMPGDRMAAANMDLLKHAIAREAPAIITAGEGPARRQVMIQFETLKSSE